jgi:hypothetical protein
MVLGHFARMDNEDVFNSLYCEWFDKKGKLKQISQNPGR